MTTAALDPRIGMLNDGRFYAFADGYQNPETVGTLAEVEAALCLRASEPKTVAAEPSAEAFDVLVSFQFPAWDEVAGILYEGIAARTKAEAIRYARRLAWDDGHTGSGKGRITYKTVAH